MQWGNQICDEGAAALGRGLSFNNSLRELDLVSRSVAWVHLCFCVKNGIGCEICFGCNHAPFSALVLFYFVLCLFHCCSSFVQSRNRTSVAGVCRVVSCILYNGALTAVTFDHKASACVASDFWRREGLAVPPDEAVDQGWIAVLAFLRRERVR